MSTLPFKQVDVFTSEPFKGNPLAVVFDADDLSGEDMQRIANWIHLSETAFVLSSDKADYRVRIFTLTEEIPFAGHPTVGAAHAAREAGIIPMAKFEFVQECQAGLIPLKIDREGGALARAPRPKSIALDSEAALVDALGGVRIDTPMIVDVGPKWVTARLEDASLLYALEIDFSKMKVFNEETASFGVNLYTVDNDSVVHVRSFAPAVGVPEDPVCGSGNAAVGAHIKATGLISKVGMTYTARQGSALGRDGRIRVMLDGEDVFIGGHSVTVIDGSIMV